jgi:DNA-binding CsgD family transcriptional regulator
MELIMSVIYTPAMIRRDERILAWYEAGKKYEWIANKTGLSVGRVYQILAKTGAKRAA